MRGQFLAGVAALLVAAAPAAAQQPTRPDTTARDTTRAAARRDTTAARDTTLPRLRVAPAKAFYRSLIVPGWGEASAGNYVRGGVFFALAATSDYMLVNTIRRLSSAQDAWHKAAIDSVAARLADTAQVLSGADTLLRSGAPDREARLALWHAQKDTLVGAYSLVRSRRRQREDRIFQALFVTLIGGVDAFINAQLSDFPAGVGVEPKGNGRYQVRVDVALPARKPPR